MWFRNELSSLAEVLLYSVFRGLCAFVDTVRLAKHVSVIQLNSIKNWVFVLEKHCVFLELAVGTEILIIISV